MNIRLVCVAFTLVCAGCGSQIAISGKERTEYLNSIKPYGAHWVKEGMTRESRRADFVACGGAHDLNTGYVIKPGITVQQSFAASNEHVNRVLTCMQTKGYVYQHHCDTRCLHP